MSGVGSAERILAILDLFSEDRLDWTPDELMAATGYARPTLYRYLKALKSAGLVTTTSSGAVYTLGPKVVELDYLSRRSDPLIREGVPVIQGLAARWPCTALLVRWYGNRILCIASECSVSGARSSYLRGRPMPLARGAISRAILAYLPRRQMLQKIAENRDDLRALGLGKDDEEIAESFRLVRRQGAAVARGEVTPGVVGVAAPIFTDGPSPVAAICTTIAQERAPDHLIPRIADDVWKTAERLSMDLAEQAPAKFGPNRRGCARPEGST
ncbi:MAG: IclR family transcriptional regulator [Tranquillimonas sp.]|jgi:DNA-binding IclR family transcriptional regulator